MLAPPVYYNELDEYPAAWLRNLIAAGHLPGGDVDTRSIADVQPEDLLGYRHCHFFAGIGGWPLAARLVGWPADRELWTGSCPCQPFSQAGAGRGHDDARHLWPHQLRLLGARRPAVWLGEQVANAIGHGWLDGVFADLEAIGYAGRATVVPACAVDAPHRRDRIWIVGERGALDHGECPGLEGHAWHGLGTPGRSSSHRSAPEAGGDRALVDADVAGSGAQWEQRSGEQRGAGRYPWARHRWIVGHDGRARRVEPDVRLLADGVPARVGRLRAYGNAVVPQVAAEVMRAYLDCRP